MPASRGGKVKTVLQAVAIGLYVLPLSGGWHLAAELVMAAAVVVTVVTGADYVIRARTLRRTSPRAQAKRARRAAAGAGAEAEAAQVPEQAAQASERTTPAAEAPDRAAEPVDPAAEAPDRVAERSDPAAPEPPA
jgi:CDP-diacylglycerol--glycerol-3-phosphate 3-phosphatidyltransferase